MKTYFLLHFEYKNYVLIIIKIQSYSSAARSSIQKFENDCDVIFVFKM